MESFELSRLVAGLERTSVQYTEFLRQPAISAGFYVLPAGADDPQKPHSEDEIYYVLEGKASIRVGDEDQTVGPGSLVFVGAHVEHRFHGITEDLILLVLFAPARRSKTA